MLSAWGPTTTCTARPTFNTPNAPAARRRRSSISETSRTSTRRRVMHGSIVTMFSPPPRPARISCACDTAARSYAGAADGGPASGAASAPASSSPAGSSAASSSSLSRPGVFRSSSAIKNRNTV
jgi:hypothetical protein